MTPPLPTPLAAVEAMARYPIAVELVRAANRGSTSLVQRTLGIGYNAACRLIGRMEAEGILSAPNSAGVRTVLPYAPPAPGAEGGG